MLYNYWVANQLVQKAKTNISSIFLYFKIDLSLNYYLEDVSVLELLEAQTRKALTFCGIGFIPQSHFEIAINPVKSLRWELPLNRLSWRYHMSFSGPT